MSIIYAASPKHCAAKQRLPHLKHLKEKKKLIYALSTLIFSLLLLSLLIYLILHPSKPEFSLADAAVYDLSLSSPPLQPRLLNSTIYSTIVSKNRNTHVGVYYDRLRAYAVYKGQQITADAHLPPFYQGHGDTNLLSASLSAAALPLAPSVGYEVSRAQTAGKLLLRFRLDGQLRWKVGSWVSGRYRLDVDCVAVVAYVAASAGSPPTAVQTGSVQGAQCSTNV